MRRVQLVFWAVGAGFLCFRFWGCRAFYSALQSPKVTCSTSACVLLTPATLLLSESLTPCSPGRPPQVSKLLNHRGSGFGFRVIGLRVVA